MGTAAETACLPPQPSAGSQPGRSRSRHPAWSVLRVCALIAIDLTLLAAGLAIGTGLRLALIPGRLDTSHAALHLYALCGACWVAMFLYERIYGAELQTADQADRIVKALAGGLVIAVLISFAAHQANAVSRAVLAGWFGVNLMLFMLVRPRLAQLVSSATRHGSVLVVSDGAEASAALTLAFSKAGFRAQVVSWDCDPEWVPPGEQEAVVVCLPPAGVSDERLSRWERRFPNLGVIPATAMTPLGAHSVDLHGIQLFALSHPLDRLGNRTFKRAFDIAVSSFLLLALSPLLFVLASAVKLDSPGPILFRHRRLGRHGRPFAVLKFRSMVADAEQRLRELLANNADARREYAETYKLKRDPRITRTGRFLRRYSLDELPQLWNVLRGDMSLVGPRPITNHEVVLYGAVYPIVAAVRPGLTGVWQVSGRSDVSYESRQRFDLGYIRNWSVSRDCAVLLRTVAAVFSPHAY
jgi:Undecaprenyl-phosphate galactose phosphotransferase WbaP